MHSRIIQISETPIVDKIEASMFYDGFVGSIADYVDKDVDVGADYEWIFENKDAFALNIENATVTIKNKEAFFSPMYREWKKYLDLVKETTFEEFYSGKKDVAIWQMEEAYENKYGFYVSDNYGNMTTFTSWMHMAENGETYYLGPTIDYHF